MRSATTEDEAGCEQCDGRLGRRAVVLSGGAFRVIPLEGSGFPEVGLDSDRPVLESFGMREAVGFLQLCCDDEDSPACVDLVDHDAAGGEFGLHFCSTSCLRSFLSAQVDALDAELAAK